ncbi:BON domain-containing protein [Rhizobium halophytocola]|uniref:BON domain-containing protein n=1 Tax=Rhizobium halophytocola TaxID=735519 RepID=A0ABS4DZN3_9HYPH|nr:BON domain-containing protein [Rhizobium halophytocola]MBP1851161.1 hypothetical protein [Rhizobium halophytocola]
MANEKNDLSREEDYRDFNQHNVEDGWPYDDEPGGAAKPVGNGAYGEGEANFDRDRNHGFRVTEAEASGLEHAARAPVLPETDHREDSDDIESRVEEAIEAIDGVDVLELDLHVDGHRLTISGSVDTPQERRQVELAALSVKGVAEVRNEVRTRGVDTHIPADADE